MHPLLMRTLDVQGRVQELRAINEVSLFRQTAQAAHLRILIDDQERLAELVADGVLVATPAGSTAYNLSVQGPIIPINAPLLALTAISPFRAAALARRAAAGQGQGHHRGHGCRQAAGRSGRRFRRGALGAPRRCQHGSRHFAQDPAVDPGHNLDERILSEQFGF